MAVIAIVGPTAASKSELAMQLAGELSGEIVSVDSMQVYRGLDIGTAKPSPSHRNQVTHHLIDVVEPEDSFTVAEHQALGLDALADIGRRGSSAVIVGGSGLHFRALVDPLEFPPSAPDVRAEIESMDNEDAAIELLKVDSAAASHVDMANPRRVARALEVHRLTGRTPSQRASTDAAAAVRNYESRVPMLAFGLDPGDALATRVAQRFDAMLQMGLLEEVRGLQDRLGITASQGVGYKELLPVVSGDVPLEDARQAAIASTMALAKRQRTFFGRDPRIRWLPWDTGADNVDRLAAMARDAIRETAWIS